MVVFPAASSPSITTRFSDRHRMGRRRRITPPMPKGLDTQSQHIGMQTEDMLMQTKPDNILNQGVAYQDSAHVLLAFKVICETSRLKFFKRLHISNRQVCVCDDLTDPQVGSCRNSF